MKIGVTTFGGDGGKSGISQYIIHLLRQFVHFPGDDTWDVAVYGDEQDIFIPASSRIKPVVFSKRLHNPVINILWHQLSLKGLCRKQKWDVLFLPAANRRIPFSVPCPTVGTVHDFSSLYIAGKYDYARTFYIKQILPQFVRRLTHVITPSESSKKDVMEYARVPEKRIHVIPQGVEHDFYFPGDREPSAKKICQKYGIKAPYILYVSRLEHPGKNHVRLLRAFCHAKCSQKIPHSLVCVGSDWNNAAEIHRLAEKLPCSNDIIFTGFAPAADLPDFYRSADFLVFPSLYEGFGIPVLEAMACGLPVACSNISSLPEVGGEAAIYFDPKEESTISHAILTLSGNAGLAAELSRKGILQSKKFTWEITAQKTLEIIHKAYGEK